MYICIYVYIFNNNKKGRIVLHSNIACSCIAIQCNLYFYAVGCGGFRILMMGDCRVCRVRVWIVTGFQSTAACLQFTRVGVLVPGASFPSDAHPSSGERGVRWSGIGEVRWFVMGRMLEPETGAAPLQWRRRSRWGCQSQEVSGQLQFGSFLHAYTAIYPRTDAGGDVVIDFDH